MKIIDNNLSPTMREIATTPYFDVAEIMAAGYAKVRYGGRLPASRLKTIDVIDDDGAVVAKYGYVTKPQIGRVQ